MELPERLTKKHLRQAADDVLVAYRKQALADMNFYQNAGHARDLSARLDRIEAEIRHRIWQRASDAIGVPHKLSPQTLRTALEQKAARFSLTADFVLQP